MDNTPNNNGMPPKQINRVATPIKLDEHGNRIEEPVKQVVKKPIIVKEHNAETAIFITVLLIILAILCAFIFYFIVPRYLESKNNKITYNDATTTTTKVINNHFDEVNLNNNNLIESGSFEVFDSYKLSKNNREVFVNDVKITDADYLLPTIGSVDDLILFVTQDKKNRTTKLYSVDKLGRVVLELYNLPNVDGMVLMSDPSSFIYNSVSLVFIASRVENNNLILNNEFASLKGINMCVEDELNKNNVNKEFMAIGTYSIEYLGDHKFSNPILLHSISVEDYITQKNVCK